MSWDVSTEVAERLALLMEKVGPSRWEELEERLRQGTIRELDDQLNLAKLNKSEAANVFEAAREVYDHGQEIVRQRKALHELIHEAGSAIRRVERTIKTLDELGDVEYMDGNADIEHFLGEAARSLRAAQALAPTDRDGN